jgi:hypothetical protein
MSFSRIHEFKLIVMLALFVGLASSALAKDDVACSHAGIIVQGNKALATGKMGELALVNANRDYAFTKVPKCIEGLNYISHMHKASASVACTANVGGRAYICLTDGLTPAGLKVPGEWKEVGKMTGGDASGTMPWRIFQCDLTTGQKFAIRSAGKWGAVVVAGKIDARKPLPTLAKGRKRAARGGLRAGGTLDDEFALTASQLRARKAGGAHYERLAKEVFRKPALLFLEDRDPVDVALRRTAALLDDIKKMKDAPDLSKQAGELAKFKTQAVDVPVTDEAARRKLFDEVRKVRRQIAFSNPLIDFDKIAFATHHKTHGHMCDQYFGFHAKKGGSIFVLENAFSDKPVARDLLKGEKIQNGRLKGKTLAEGSHMSLELSYDAKTILFAWTEALNSKYKWSEQSTYHIFKANIDPANPVNLTQLTDGKTNDFDPCFLPSGRIVFISERRGGFGRCHGRAVPTYTLHTMKPDGSDIIAISYHETNEWHPSVDNNGMIIYSRWDYVDRDSDVAHHIWVTYPDGRDPRSYHGNYPIKRESRPWMELSNRAIPGSHRYVGVSTPHHGQNYGSMILIDHQIEDDNSMSQLKRITPELQLTESEKIPGIALPRGRNGGGEVYGQPWPLSEDYYLCVYDPGQRNYALCLMDSFGNREVLYRDPSVPCLDPIPLRPRTKPRIIPSMTTQAVEDKALMPASPATISVMNIYDSDFKWPEGSKVTAMRIVQLFPKATHNANQPAVGLAAQSLARGVLGTVPVEADGSAYFVAPVGVPIYFQALDDKGQAIQSMKSNTYVHESEKLACQGCHEPKLRMSGAKRKMTVAMALKRAPSKINPDVEGSYPLTFPRLVQPVIDKKCLPCHVKNAKKKAPNLSGKEFGRGGWSKAFESLKKYGWGKSGGNGAIFGNKTSRSIPGQVGAKASKLLAHLTNPKGHHDLKLTPEELYRITLWIDCNTNFYGAYLETAKQARGELVMPSIE